MFQAKKALSDMELLRVEIRVDWLDDSKCIGIQGAAQV